MAIRMHGDDLTGLVGYLVTETVIEHLSFEFRKDECGPEYFRIPI